MTTTHHIGYIKILRQALGAESEDDTIFDSKIFKLSLMDRVRLIAQWELGYSSWAGTFKNYFESQGLYLTTDPTAKGVIL